MTNTPLRISIGAGTYVAGLAWEEFPQNAKSIFRRDGFLKKQAAESNSAYWAVNPKLAKPMPSTDGRRTTPERYAMLAKSDGELPAKSYSAALLFASYVELIAPEHTENSIFILIAEMNSGSSGTTYWTCAVDQHGIVQYDLISDSESVITGHATSFITFKSHVLFLDCDEQEQSNLTHLLNQHSDTSISTSTINADVWERHAAKSTDRKWLTLRASAKTSINTKPLTNAVTVALLLGVSYVAAGYWSQTNAISQLDKFASTNTGPSTTLYTAPKKSKSGVELWNKTTFQMSVYEQFQSFESENPSSPKAIIDTLFDLSERVPLYLNEFRFSKLVYAEGYVFTYFVREPKSSTVTYFLDTSIAELNRHLNVELTPVDLKKLPEKLKVNDLREEGNLRIYATKVDHDRQPTVDVREISTRYREIYAELVELSETVKRTHADKDNLLARYEGLSWSDIVIDRKPEGLLADYQTLLNEASSNEERLKTAEAKLKEIHIPSIEPSKLIGQVMDFITMMQLDDKFTWSYPTLLTTFPDKKSIEADLQGKKTKADGKPKAGSSKKEKSKPKKSSVFMPEPVAEAHVVSITSNKEKDVESNLKITSFGNLDLLQLKELINKPFVHILDIQYDMESGQWAVRIAFTRKRPAFTAMMTQGSAL